jgi:hypothetical protein
MPLANPTAVEVPHHLHGQRCVLQGEQVGKHLAGEHEPDQVPRRLRDKLQLVQVLGLAIEVFVVLKHVQEG